MIHELRTYTLRPDKVLEYLRLTREIGYPLRSRHSPCRGYWTTEVGDLNEAVHLWVYKDLNERAAARAKALADPEWQAFLGKALPLLITMQSTVLIPTPASPMK